MDFNEYMMSLIGDQGEQKRQAELLRGKTNSQLSEAVGQSKRYNTIAAVAPMLSNPGLAKSAEVLVKQGEEEAPKISAQQIYYGGEGRLEENPIYTEAKAAEREGRVQNIFAQQLAANERAGEANSLKYTLGVMADQTRRDMNAQNAALRMTLAQMAVDRKGAEAVTKAEKADAKAKETDEKAVQEFQKRYSAVGLPNLVGSVDRFNTKVQGYIDKNQSIPGIGYGSSQVSGVPFLSDVVLGAEGKENRAQIQSVANALLAADSGKAVTLSEEERQTLTTMASGKFSEKDTLNAWKDIIVPRVNEMRGGVVAGFKPEVINTYADRYSGYNPSIPITPAQRKQDAGKGANTVPPPIKPKSVPSGWKIERE